MKPFRLFAAALLIGASAPAIAQDTLLMTSLTPAGNGTGPSTLASSLKMAVPAWTTASYFASSPGPVGVKRRVWPAR